LTQVEVDAVYNVIGILPGSGGGPKVLLAAHLDTVFPRGTDLTVRREGSKLYAPGIRDNSFGVTSLLWLIKALKEFNIQLPGDLICVATSGEEGLGDLKGMKAVMERFHKETDYVIAIDGGLGGLTNGGITSRRFKVTLTAAGGHSYGAFGASSAIHSMGRMIAGIADLKVPTNPKTTFNVGVVSGGNSVNSIAATAEMLIDMRSEQRDTLMKLEGELMAILEDVKNRDGIEYKAELLGDRPGGATPPDHPLVTTIQALQESLGVKSDLRSSSTDANVPIGYGIPAVCMGCATGGNAHRLDEWLDTENIDIGMTLIVQVVAKVMDLKTT
jgi:acetylornithine deacetylase/succinyl-diaminopimelate desuccinylase-like protein